MRTVTAPTMLTLALTMALAAIGTILSLRQPELPLLPPHHGAALVVITLVLGAAFMVTELGQALVEVRSQAYSFSLSGVPLLLGLLYLPPTILLPVRIMATVAAFLIQRASGLKFAYNSAAYLLDTALVIAIAHHLVGGQATLSLRTAALCYVALAVVDVIMSTLVLVVIRINQGPMTLGEAAEVLVPAAFFVALNTAVGFTCAILLSDGALGVVLLVTFIAVTATGYRAYLVLRRRHQSLQVVQDFIKAGEATTTVEELSEHLLRQIQVLVRASSVELTLHPVERLGGQQAESLRVAVHDGGGMSVEAALDRPGDWLLHDCIRRQRSALVNETSTDPAGRRWLAERGIRDALVVPIDGRDARGALVALDRLGDSTRFTGDDLALLTTLAGHFAVALQSRQLVQRLQYEATHDVLTGLPNRALIAERMCQALSGPAGDERAAVLLLDLNRFKEVNDALGHHVGDQLLQVVGERLRHLPLRDATVARLGGDEFAVFLPPSPAPERMARTVAQNICESLAAPVDLPDVTVSTEASIGIAVAAAGQSHTDLMRHADTAMYAAKDSGVPWEIYSPDLDRGRAERLALLADLRLALDRDELQLHYQPKLDLTFGVVTSVEALVRWTHPTLGPLAPDAFIPLAESTGLIEQLTNVVLTKALKQCRAWQDDGVNLAVAVNLSARNVNNAELPDQVAAALVEAGLPAHRLILEITESSVMGDPERTVPTLNRLAAIGVALSLDDFGTGYSSLSYLQRLPVREVKIDRSFVLGLTHPTQSHASIALVRSIISLGQSLNLRIVAEGVETEEVLEQLRDLGCHIIQGYHVGRPVPADVLIANMARAGLHAGVVEIGNS